MGSYEFNDAKGWWYTFFHDMGKYKLGLRHQVMLYYAASVKYPTGPAYFAEDGMGRPVNNNQRFDCTIDPSSGEFEPLCIQGRDSLRMLANSTWDRTLIRNASPITLRVARFPFQGLPSHKKDATDQWNSADWASVSMRWFLASLVLGTGIADFINWCKMMNFDDTNQRNGTDSNKYLPFLFNDSRYPRIARNRLENKAEVREHQPLYSGLVTNNVGTYRAFRPRYLCYLKDNWFDMSSDEWFEVKPVTLNDHTPYIFISYSKTQFFKNRGVDKKRDDKNGEWLEAYIRGGLLKMRDHGSSHEPRAFWFDVLCQSQEACNEYTGERHEITDAKERERLTDYDVYTMSDIIRGAERTLIFSQISVEDPKSGKVLAESDAASALRLWGRRVWTLPEVLLSRGDNVTVICVAASGHLKLFMPDVDKVRLAELAWEDAHISRQLVEHFRSLPLSRLEFVRFAVQCIHNRDLEWFLPGDRSYALMGLLRLRPPIDSTDSSFTAFARLSLSQDSDRLMERLICLLPKIQQKSWEEMSDQYSSSLWDVYPSTQVCGVGENDTIIVDGLKGAMIQWSKFPNLDLLNKMTLVRIIILLVISSVPLFLLCFGIVKAVGIEGVAPIEKGAISDGIVKATIGQDTPTAAALLTLWLVISILMPMGYQRLYKGKLWNVEPGLFGVEGYVPLEDLEEKLFGLRLHRLQWSTNGSPLSRHQVRRGYEAGCEEYRSDEIIGEGFSSRAELGKSIHTYPIEGIDPLSKCSRCEWGNGVSCDAHLTPASASVMENSRYGDLKLFTLIDTVSMTATLFESAGPPVALLAGGEEGGMQRALACSYDITTGTMHRETVLRVPTLTLETMHGMPRVRLGLASSFKFRHQQSDTSTAYVSPVTMGNSQDKPSYSITTLEDSTTDIPLLDRPALSSANANGMAKAKGWVYQTLR